MKKLIILACLMGVTMTVSACGGDGSSKTVVVTPGSPPTASSKFGAKFDAAIKADPNSTPTSVAAGDLPDPDVAASPSAVN